MPLTPKDIELKTFRASFRGYAEDEVDEFLEEMIASVSEYQQTIRERDARLADTGAVPTGPQDVAGANEEANRILQAARRQAEQILEEARARALEVEAATTGAAAVLTPDQVAERERLLIGYERLRSELSLVRSRVQKALSASQEAFSIMEGQVESIIEDAGPTEQVEPIAIPVTEAPDADGGDGSPVADDGPDEQPRRPWER